MPDLTGLPALDVAIGLAFVYFVLSLVCSAVNEAIASVFRLRAKDLERGIRSIVEDPAKVTAFYDNPRVKALHQRVGLPGIPDRKPSYIPPRVFSLALIDTLSSSRRGDLLADARAEVDGIEPSTLKTMVSDALADAHGNVNRFRAALEQSFDEVMDRVSGWYKRRVQAILLVIALVIVGFANVNSFAIGDRLYRDDAVRAAVVARATQQTSPTDCDQDPATTGVEEAAKCVEGLADLGLPLGWSEATNPDTVEGSFFKALGLLITAFALSLGAPFWFDTLGKLARLRGTGNREGTLKINERAPSDRDERPLNG